jgi:hypothetical protein
MTAPYLLVIAHQRSGSNHLLDLLRGFVGVTTLGEFFNITASAPGKMHQFEALAQYDGSVEQFKAAAEKNPLDTLRFREQIPGTRLFVIKLFRNQLRSKRARRILAKNALGIIHLRRNIFGAWVSRELAKQSDHWFNESSEHRLVRFSSQRFIEFGARYTVFTREMSGIIRRSGRPFVDLTFSDMPNINKPHELVDRISQAFPELRTLVERDDWKPRVVRQDNRLPIDRVENSQDAKATLVELGLECLLNNADTDDLNFLHSVFSQHRAKPLLSSITTRVFRRLVKK